MPLGTCFADGSMYSGVNCSRAAACKSFYLRWSLLASQLVFHPWSVIPWREAYKAADRKRPQVAKGNRAELSRLLCLVLALGEL